MVGAERFDLMLKKMREENCRWSKKNGNKKNGPSSDEL